MKAVLFTGLNKIQVYEWDEPKITNDNDVLVEISACGICGSDIHYLINGKIGSQIVKYPHISGHEASGIVLETGKSVKKVKKGDKIAIEPAVSCLKCDQCIAGRFNTCRNIKFLGCPDELTGAFSEKIVIPERNCFKIPETLPVETAAFAEPLSISIYSVQRSGRMKNKSIAILGTGPIGLGVLLAAKIEHPRKIYVTDKIKNRLDTAMKLGADWCGNANDPELTKVILSEEPHQVDTVFECSGNFATIAHAFEILKPGGLLVIVGIPEDNDMILKADQFRRKELTVTYIRRQNECLESAVKFLDSIQEKAKLLITHKFKYEKAETAFDTVSKYKDGIIKAIFVK